MQLKTLENQSIPELCKLFNDAFSDYFVKIKLTSEAMQKKLKSEDVDLNLSVGVFYDKKPVGFILHAYRDGVAYNAGTGVIPNFRGNHLTQKMYQYILPLLKENGVRELELEVIDENTQAIKSYKSAGYHKVVDLDCYKGIPFNKKSTNNLQIKEISTPEFDLFERFWEWQPTWQHTTKTIRNVDDYKCYVVFLNEKPVAYACMLPEKGRVAQFAVHPDYRRQGIGTALFHFLKQQTESELYIINVDGDHTETKYFLQAIGLEIFSTQYKMKLNL